MRSPAHTDDVLDRDREVPVYGFELRNVARMGSAALDLAAVNYDLAAVNIHRAENRAKECGLPRPAGANQPHEVSGHYREVDIEQHRPAVIAACNRTYL